MFSCNDPEIESGLKVNPKALVFLQNADSKTIDFYASEDWTAEITKGAEWVSLDMMSGSNYKGVLTIEVSKNPNDNLRHGEITFTMGTRKELLSIEQRGNALVGVVVPEPIMRPDILTPVDYVPGYVYGGMDGVTIEVTDKFTNNFKFTITPGANIQSYRLDVYPLCRLYNSLYEGMRAAGRDMNTPLDAEQVESFIRGFIFDDSGSGAYTFSTDNMDDFLRHEFDWMNTPYAQAMVVPDCEYVIAAVGCFDKDGFAEGDMTLCYVRTPYYPLEGDPRVEMDVLTTFTAMQLNYKPNSDAYYFYEWCSNESDLKPYIATYGEKLYIDFMRNAIYEPKSTSDEEALTFYMNFGNGASPDVPIMATTIGLDAQCTPAKSMESEVFKLRKRPENTPDAEATITIDQEHVGATTFWLDVELGANCSAAVMKVYTKEEADELQKLSDAEKAVLAQTIYDDGWGFGNRNYAYNTQTDELLGSGFKMSEPWIICNSDTEYVVVYTAMNQYKELMPLKFTETVHTKPIVKNTPELSEEDAVLELTADGVQNVTVKFTYDFEKTSKIHWQYIAGLSEDMGLPTEESGTREDFVSLLYEEGDSYDNPYGALVNHWEAVPAGVDSFTDVLFPDTKFTVAYVAEDWNGVLGEVKFASATTDPLIGGPDPQMSITPAYNSSNEPFYVFTMVQDAMQMYTAVCTSLEMESLKDLGNRNKLRYKDAVALFENFIMNNGIERMALSTSEKASELSVALGMAIGGEPGAPIYGPMEHLIYAGGEFRTLAYYYPNDVPAEVQSALQRVRQQVITAHERPVGYVHSSKLPKVDYGTRTMNFEEFAEGKKVEMIDYKKLSSHPKASGR